MPNFDLLREAAAIIDGIPRKHFDLREILSSPELDDFDRRPLTDAPKHAACGAIGCAMGWLALHPKFNAIGLTVSAKEASYGSVLWCGDTSDYATAASELFDIAYSEALWLFSPPGSSKYDYEIDGKDFADLSSKQLFKHRIRKFFAEHGQPVNSKF